MKFPDSFHGLRTLVLGGGISGNAAVGLLVSLGAEPILCDRNRPQSLSIPYLPDTIDPFELPPVSLIVKSPGILPAHPILTYAFEKKIPVVSEIDLGRNFFPGKLLGVTGTDGKSTTTALAAHLLRRDFPDLREGGNLGIPFSSFCREPISLAVLELSSYQLEDSSPLRLDVSVFLNLAPDHLERHKTMENYFRAKLKIADAKNPAHVFVVSEKIKSFLPETSYFECTIRTFGKHALCDAFLDEAENKIRTSRYEYDISGFYLPGSHNRENLAAAILAAEAIGGKPESIQSELVSFRGLPHRFQIAGEKKGLFFVNDSKSTNLHSMLAGMSTWKNPEETLLILGGRPKQEDPKPLYDFVMQGIGSIVLIGEARSVWEQGLRERMGVRLISLESLKDVFLLLDSSERFSDKNHNDRIRLKNGTNVASIVFSPACASFDQYKNFEERGNHFLSLVRDFLNEPI
ncbi:UDP-N-acetylmuramoyl-L-alanine--D-glutamate ligase [Leptospira gomenensis]|uniref:UDP-N-acetylmuramoylalanine--D-glutamate ligase n=1 Tax=Leptospira gomenensis TaxID=2484974 RepID=A0A5F1YUA3_9LEPT|nr:UDP-N-acetylmuramoyl-L-alanine--D-glutamate ligase [Leptospira gomenensis]TGK31808.1 UDP-N-acetylmuramoyl-L-alanine--D-glutamate ligase [Leptospira gomenensis]TGK34780.1 UDP-N-acetylmuramoyl-L-alanine--D-glutamate ligase [Leptospira gomenensis]TGK41565.1 UDP-N-acetylmuramoyl-L-alanine--D-glutamate ligase [Leptospira gomenensis]TGK61477.1 UDP-N-acetylmuramoyl-L-alanine--D-glutamate ligase [Leptospira gomenensis]